MKKIIVIFALFGAFLISCTNATANNNVAEFDGTTLNISDRNLSVEDMYLRVFFSDSSISESLMLPVRDVAEGLGYQVDWDSIKREATIQTPDKTIIIPVDGSSITSSPGQIVYHFRDGEPRPEVKADRLYAPVRLVKEYLDFTILIRGDNNGI
ncbi:MAG: hypothetical protein BWY65_00085 [Firmicutes bacterium ADurb.Bin373]|nr:copper amine oxidase N-terminal domain-containing protein [Bacillota bacterium]OQA11289.1 MAG: hypothetical protein BWY65_00085 [Firmicutes bacterium ADurb.Bin373]